MNEEHAGENESTRTIAFGGAAGDGIREAGIHSAEILHAFGYSVALSFEYPSLIRGGHNFARMSFAKRKVWSDHIALDALIAVNAESVQLHAHEFSPNAVVIAEEKYRNEIGDILGVHILAVPMSAFAEEIHAPQVARTSAGIGALLYTLGISRDEMREVCAAVFRNVGSDMNVSLAEKGYDHAASSDAPRQEGALVRTESAGEFIDGNRAVGKGFLAAGIGAYIGYPMTPSTSLLHFMAREAIGKDIKIIHPEDEISALNMALGVAYAGKRVAVGTATGGFALMQETFAFAGIAEMPIALMVSQRQGPATGVPTHTTQADLQFILHSGHGEFPRIVIAPGDPEECYFAGAHALELAWKYQTPAIVLLDKHISEGSQTALLDELKIVRSDVSWQKDSGTGAPYRRYQDTETGISPLAVPGTPGVHVRATSYEHDETGFAIEDAAIVKKMQDKRFRKFETLSQELHKYETVKVYGDASSDVAIVFWGSTKNAVLEASRFFKRPVKMVQVLWMSPFDTDRVEKELGKARVIIDVEVNHDAQLAALVREKTRIAPTHVIRKYDATAFDPKELAEKINALIE